MQANVMCDGHRLARVTSRSFFLAEELERRIPRGYCRDIGLRISASSASQCRSPKKLSVVPSNVPGSFVNADKCYSDIT